MALEPMPGSPAPPPELKSAYRDWRWTVVWQYGPEVITYRLDSPSGNQHFLKLSGGSGHPSLEAERDRMQWAIDHLPVPRVIRHGARDDVHWLVTLAIQGRDGTAPELKGDPERFVALLAAGLRRFHAAPVEACPFDFRLEAAMDHVRQRLGTGSIRPDRDFHPEFAHLSAQQAVRLLEDTRPKSESLVVCHGDYCLPNVIVRQGTACGFVDLGALGVADRWWDLAVATWSLTWNLGPGYENLFLEEYGQEVDPDRTLFYRLLYDLGS